MDTLDKICKVFGCNIGDVMEFINDNNDTYESGGINE